MILMICCYGNDIIVEGGGRIEAKDGLGEYCAC